MNTTIEPFITKEYHTVSPYTGVNCIKAKLLQYKALVVMEENSSLPLGVLTLSDIVRCPHLLVIDCVSPKPKLSTASGIKEALESMQQQHTSTLPVYSGNTFEGLVFKRTLIRALEIIVGECVSTLSEQNNILKEISFIQSHELRQPVANILGLMQLLDTSGFDEGNKKVAELLEVCARQMDGIVRDIVQRARYNIETPGRAARR